MDSIPCLYLPCIHGSSRKMIIFFHGNAEDLGTCYSMSDHLRSALQVNVLAVEYPGYGVYLDETKTSEEKILRDAEIVYKFVQDEGGLRQKDIFLMGRSLGSGPAIHLAANYNPGCLCLISPYTSIKGVA